MLSARTPEGKQSTGCPCNGRQGGVHDDDAVFLMTRASEETASEQTDAEKIRTQRLLEEQKRLQEQTMDPSWIPMRPQCS